MDLTVDEFIQKVQDLRKEYQAQANTEVDLVMIYRAQGALEFAEKLLAFPDKERVLREMEEGHYQESPGGFSQDPGY